MLTFKLRKNDTLFNFPSNKMTDLSRLIIIFLVDEDLKIR